MKTLNELYNHSKIITEEIDLQDSGYDKNIKKLSGLLKDVGNYGRDIRTTKDNINDDNGDELKSLLSDTIKTLNKVKFTH